MVGKIRAQGDVYIELCVLSLLAFCPSLARPRLRVGGVFPY
jgi:hypothetical protein